MALMLSELLNLSEAAGFNGQGAAAVVDNHAYMSLAEATSQAPAYILESGACFMEDYQKFGNQLNEETVLAIQEGREPDYTTITEASLQSLKANIAKFFDRIIKFLQSIVAKLGFQIEKIRKSGSQLYHDHKADFDKAQPTSDLTIHGYMFSDKDPFEGAKAYITSGGADKLARAGYGGADKFVGPEQFQRDIKRLVGRPTNSEGVLTSVTDAIDSMDKVENAELEFNMAKAVLGSGIQLNESSWKSDLHEALYGEKVDISWGEGPFTAAEIDACLGTKRETQLDAIRKDYATMIKDMQDLKKSLQADVAAIESTKGTAAGNVEKTSSNKDTQDKALNTTNSIIDLSAKYYNKYITAINKAVSVLNAIKAQHVAYVSDRIKQGRTCFLKVISAKPKKKNEDGEALLGDIDEFDVVI